MHRLFHRRKGGLGKIRTSVSRALPSLSYSPVQLSTNQRLSSFPVKRFSTSSTPLLQLDDNWHRAHVVKIIETSGSARRITFRAEPSGTGKHQFTFLAGQWVDLEIPVTPGEEEFPIGGYSLASPDASCSKNERLSKLFSFPYLPNFELGIKKARKHPTTNHLHSKLQVGDRVNVKVGGRAFPEPLGLLINRLKARGVNREHVLMIAGGVGITPLYSMMLSLLSAKMDELDLQIKISLIYSAQSEADFLFLEELKVLQKHFQNNVKNGADSALSLFFLTATGREEMNVSQLKPWTESLQEINHGQLNRERLLNLVKAEENTSTQACTTSCFVCGPPSLIDDVVKFAENSRSTPKLDVFHEKW